MELSNRLKCVADMVTPDNIVADVGCDHAYTSIYLIESNIASHVIAMDINLGPLEHAVANVSKHNLAERIEVCQSDGLAVLDESDGVETVLISGMGGNLIVDILKRSSDIIRSLKELVLQPQSDIYKVRYYLHSQGFKITCEKMIYEDGKFYTIIKAIPGLESYEFECDYLYGKYLLDNPDEVVIRFLEQLHTKYLAAITAIKRNSDDNEINKSRLTELTKADNDIKFLLSGIQEV